MAFANALQSIAALATRGIPAVRSAVHGARIGAGARFAKSTVEALGFQVAPAIASVSPVAATGKLAQAIAVRDAIVSRAGVALRVTESGGVAATVSEELVASAARSTVRGALGQIGRATAFGALGGAAVDAVLAGIEIAPGVRDGSIARDAAAKHVGMRAARGAAAGAAGVAAAGIVSAAVAATGLTIAGAPVIIPFAAMVTAGALATRAFDRKFGASRVREAAPEQLPVGG